MVTLVSSSPFHQPVGVLQAEQVVAGAVQGLRRAWRRPGPAAASE